MSSNQLLQQRALRDAELVRGEIEQYRRLLPADSATRGQFGVCRADGWNITFETLDGDFFLDEPLAHRLISMAVSDQGTSMRPIPERHEVSGTADGKS
jgi:hypothetical protein